MDAVSKLLPSFPIDEQYREQHERALLTLQPMIAAFYAKFPYGDHLSNDEIREAAFWVGLNKWPTAEQARIVGYKNLIGNSRPDVYATLRREKQELQDKIDRGEIVPASKRRRRIGVRFDRD